MLPRLPLIAVALAAVACQRATKGPTLAPPGSLFLGDALGEDQSFYLSQSDLKTRMGATTAFYANAPTGSTNAFDACLAARLDALPLTADDLNLSLAGQLDAKDCETAAGVTANEITYTYRYWLGCPGGGLADTAGKTIAAIGAQAKTCGLADRFVLIDYDLIYDVDGTESVQQSDGTSTDEPYHLRQHSRFALQALSGDPCVIHHENAAFDWHDGCSLTDSTVWEAYTIAGEDQPATGHEDYLQLVLTDVTEPDSGTPVWFAAGEVSVALDDWSGTVTYTGTTTAPTYSLNNGTTTTTGTVDAD